jgi:hypothetical protein
MKNICLAGDIFYDAKEDLSTSSSAETKNMHFDGLNEISEQTSGSYRRRKLTRMESEVVSTQHPVQL